MANRLLITGGILRKNGYQLGEGKYYGTAQLLLLDLASGHVKSILSISEGNSNYPDENPNLEFTVGTIEKNQLWLSTDTEIHLYSYPDLELKQIISHPCFHNNHCVAIKGDRLYATSTGLDLLITMKKSTGEIIDIQNTDGKNPWFRFSPDIDYRKIHSTRPHDCHPNHIFWIDDELWVTRCTQEDAVCITDITKRIDISGPDKSISVHDGIVKGNHVYFTSVDGCLIIADKRTQEVIEVIELYNLDGFNGIRGWCRGLYIENNIFYIAFSRLRKTRAKGKLAWLKNFSSRGAPSSNSSILALNLDSRTIIADYQIPDGMIDAIYSILPEPDSM